LKYWYMDELTFEPITKQSGDKVSVMESKGANLTKVKVKIFVGVCILKKYVYAIGSDGHIY